MANDRAPRRPRILHRPIARWLGATAVLLAVIAEREALAEPLFSRAAGAFGSQPCSPAGCYSTYVRLWDADGDGDLDVVFANADGYFEKGAPQPFVAYANDGKGKLTDASSRWFGSKLRYTRQVTTGDVDGDGHEDLFAPSAWGEPDALFLSDGRGGFVDEAASRLPSGLASHAGATRFGDFDGDGDLDLVITDGWATSSTVAARLYVNDGKGHFTEGQSLPSPDARAGKNPLDVDLVDVDGDFDLDIVLDLHEGTSMLWKNDGKGAFSAADGAIPLQGGLKYGPAACDFDGDGDLDLAFDNAATGDLEQLLENAGDGTFTDVTKSAVRGNRRADDNGLACVDVDGDGDLDLVVASLDDVERVLENDGAGHFSALADGFSPLTDSTLAFDFGDLDGDGRLDVVTAQGESGSFENQVYLGSARVPVDTRAPRVRAVEGVTGPGGAASRGVLRFAISDAVVTDAGPRLSRAFVSFDQGGRVVEAQARFSGGDLFRAEVPALAAGVPTTFTVCAVDLRGNRGCSEKAPWPVAAGPSGGSGGASGESDSSGCAVRPGITASRSGGGADDKIAWSLLGLGACGVVLARRRRRVSF